MTNSTATLQLIAADLARQLSPDHWDLTVDTVVRTIASITGDTGLADALRPIAPLLENAPSGTGLDLAYGTPDAAPDLLGLCRRIGREVDAECAWFEDNPETWAADDQELRVVVGEFTTLLHALERIGRQPRRAAN